MTPAVGDFCLSVRQPWAFLLMAGVKPIENRTWLTAYRGPLWIHAAKTKLKEDDYKAIVAELRPHKVELPARADLVFGALLGRVQVRDCVPIEKLPPELRRHWSAEGSICWHVVQPEKLAEPIPAKGALGLWKWK